MKKIIKKSTLFGLLVTSLFLFSVIKADVASAQTVYFIDLNGNLIDANDPSAQDYLNSLNLNDVNGNGSSGSDVFGLNSGSAIGANSSTFVPAPYLQYQYFTRTIDYYNGNTGFTGNNGGFRMNTGFNGQMNNPNSNMSFLNQSYQFQPAPTLRYVYHNAEQDAISRSKIFGNRSTASQMYNPYSFPVQNMQGINTFSRGTIQNQSMTFGGGSGFVMTSQE